MCVLHWLFESANIILMIQNCLNSPSDYRHVKSVWTHKPKFLCDPSRGTLRCPCRPRGWLEGRKGK